MHDVYAPGCALMLYKPRLSAKVLDALAVELGAPVPEHLVCCHHDPGLPVGSRVINTCAGCDRRYRSLYESVSTISLWEVLAASSTFPFPDYQGAEMTVHDACPTRTESRVHDAVRALLGRMNVTVVEPHRTRERAQCCGDSRYGSASDERVIVYCISCAKAMHVGGKRPRYLVDLLFGEETQPGLCEPGPWHAELEAFISAH